MPLARLLPQPRTSGTYLRQTSLCLALIRCRPKAVEADVQIEDSFDLIELRGEDPPTDEGHPGP